MSANNTPTLTVQAPLPVITASLSGPAIPMAQFPDFAVTLTGDTAEAVNGRPVSWDFSKFPATMLRMATRNQDSVTKPIASPAPGKFAARATVTGLTLWPRMNQIYGNPTCSFPVQATVTLADNSKLTANIQVTAKPLTLQTNNTQAVGYRAGKSNIATLHLTDITCTDDTRHSFGMLMANQPIFWTVGQADNGISITLAGYHNSTTTHTNHSGVTHAPVILAGGPDGSFQINAFCAGPAVPFACTLVSGLTLQNTAGVDNQSQPLPAAGATVQFSPVSATALVNNAVIPGLATAWTITDPFNTGAKVASSDAQTGADGKSSATVTAAGPNTGPFLVQMGMDNAAPPASFRLFVGPAYQQPCVAQLGVAASQRVTGSSGTFMAKTSLVDATAGQPRPAAFEPVSIWIANKPPFGYVGLGADPEGPSTATLLTDKDGNVDFGTITIDGAGSFDIVIANPDTAMKPVTIHCIASPWTGTMALVSGDNQNSRTPVPLAVRLSQGSVAVNWTLIAVDPDLQILSNGASLPLSVVADAAGNCGLGNLTVAGSGKAIVMADYQGVSQRFTLAVPAA